MRKIVKNLLIYGIGLLSILFFNGCLNEEKDKIWQILDVEKEVGICLTESRAMYPAASVSGWYFSHPESRYFSVLGND